MARLSSVAVVLAVLSFVAVATAAPTSELVDLEKRCVASYAQCGGSGFTGSTSCCTGSCVYVNYWYYMCITATVTDSLSVYNPPSGFAIDKLPCDTSANMDAKVLYRRLTNTFQRYMISGQAEASWNTGKEEDEFNYIKTNTGKSPVIRMFDVMDHYPGHPDNNAIARMKAWGAAGTGGIVQLQWHWRAPIGAREFYTASTSFDVSKAVTSGTAENTAILADIDFLITTLKDLQNQHFAILFRPLHEGYGTWFWWGAKGSGPLVKLWTIVQDRIKNAGVHNLLYVANMNECSACYPATNRYDIASMDKYAGTNDNAIHNTEFWNIAGYSGPNHKIIAMTENDGIPDPTNAKNNGALWSWFGTWNQNYLYDMSKTTLKSYYTSSIVATKDEWDALGLGL